MSIETNSKIAFEWITNLLMKHEIPFQIAGGLAAMSYGVERSLNDIDIDIPENAFKLIMPDVQNFITFGPSRFKDELWDIYLLTLNYYGQVIDLAGAYGTKIFNQQTQIWEDLPVDFSRVVSRIIFGKSVTVIPLEELIRYKTILNREVDQTDLRALRTIS